MVLPALLLALSPAAPAPQLPQFREQAGLLPGTRHWANGVTAADVDGDGDLDLLFAEGDGYLGPGAERQNVLIVNLLVETSVLAFADESVARLGAHESHAQKVLVGDVTGDGWVDLIYLNAFHTDPPHLYVNRGAAAPGFFTMESALRGFTTPFSSRSGQLADMDDDGDLDVVIADMGPTPFGAPGAPPRIFLNEGAGFFSEHPIPLPVKVGQSDVSLIDVDLDWDLDIYIANRGFNPGGNHHLLLNQLDGTFVDASALIPSTNGQSHAAEGGDLDGDGDVDFFLLSATGQSEAVLRNNLIGLGSLSYTKLPPLAGADFDREVALFDHDMDGDLDALLGSDGGTELVMRNEGGLAFTPDPTRFQPVADPTTDLAVADVTADGRPDVVTAQGGPAVGDRSNKLYRNTGPFDTRPPRIVRFETPQSLDPAGPFVVHAQVRDEVFDDGVDWVSGTAHSIVETTPGPLQAFVTIDETGFVPNVLQVPSGTSVFWTNASNKFQSVSSTNPVFPFDSGIFGPGGGFERRFITPGTYPVKSTSGFSGQVVVTGGAQQTPSLSQGDGIHRFAMPDTAAGAGTRLCYDLLFTDRAGNLVALANQCVELIDCGAAAYCIGKLNSVGCEPVIAASGHSSVSQTRGYMIRSSLVRNNKPGVLLYGMDGAQQAPFQGGFLCIQNPVRRSTAVFSFGNPAPANDCSGKYAIDFNAFASGALGGNPHPDLAVPGTLVFAQWWGRDPDDPAGTSLSNAIQFSRCP